MFKVLSISLCFLLLSTVLACSSAEPERNDQPPNINLNVPENANPEDLGMAGTKLQKTEPDPQGTDGK